MYNPIEISRLVSPSFSWPFPAPYSCSTPLQGEFQLTEVSLPTSHAVEAAVHRLHGRGIPPAIIHFERWGFSRSQRPSSELLGYPMTMETPILKYIWTIEVSHWDYVEMLILLGFVVPYTSTHRHSAGISSTRDVYIRPSFLLRISAHACPSVIRPYCWLHNPMKNYTLATIVWLIPSCSLVISVQAS